jgi:hypothetical protein
MPELVSIMRPIVNPRGGFFSGVVLWETYQETIVLNPVILQQIFLDTCCSLCRTVLNQLLPYNSELILNFEAEDIYLISNPKTTQINSLSNLTKTKILQKHAVIKYRGQYSLVLTKDILPRCKVL